MIAEAAVDQSLWAVRLTAAQTTGQVKWYRRYAGRDTFIATGATAVDYTPPLGHPHTYIAVDDTDSDTAGPVTVESDAPVLSSTTSALARQVRVMDYRPYRGEGRSVWHPVLGRTDPFVTIHRALYPAGLLRLYARDNSERVELIQMLALGEPLTLRTTCADRLDSMTFLMLSWADPFAGDGAKSGPAYLEIDYQRVTDVPGLIPPPPLRTYQTVLAEHLAYQDVLDSYTTYRDLLDGTTIGGQP